MEKIIQMSIDIETYSDVDLLKSGVYRYSESPAFEILFFGVSVNGGPVHPAKSYQMGFLMHSLMIMYRNGRSTQTLSALVSLDTFSETIPIYLRKVHQKKNPRQTISVQIPGTVILYYQPTTGFLSHSKKQGPLSAWMNRK